MDMLGNYEQRKVARYEEGELVIDTCSVTDGNKPYETAVAHPQYDNREFIIVDAYDTREESLAGHENWVSKMTTEPLPNELVDCLNSDVAKLANMAGVEHIYKRSVNE